MTLPTTTIPGADLYETYFVPAMFRPLARAVLKRAAVKEGERVLDLACGTGIIARQVAPVVNHEGRVVALDARAEMIETASKLTVPYGCPIEWKVGDATRLDAPAGSFDLVVCQQGLPFFSDRAAALAEVRRVLAPGGRAVFAVWELELAEPAELRRGLEAAGFRDVELERQTIDVGLSAEALVESVVNTVAPLLAADHVAMRTLLRQATFPMNTHIALAR